MTAHHLTGSKLGLARHCTWSFRSDVAQPTSVPGRAAQLGSVVHKLVEMQLTVNRLPAVLDTLHPDPELVAEAVAIHRGPIQDFLLSRPWQSENGLCYDAATDTCEAGPRRGEPGYDVVSRSQMRTTTDLIHIDGDVATCWDLKTGKPPTDAEQLYGQAVAVSRRFNVSTVKVAYLRALKTKAELLNEETLDADALDAHAGEIGRLLRRLPMAEPGRGDWCWRCSAFSICPAQQDAKQAELAEAGMFG